VHPSQRLSARIRHANKPATADKRREARPQAGDRSGEGQAAGGAARVRRRAERRGSGGGRSGEGQAASGVAGRRAERFQRQTIAVVRAKPTRAGARVSGLIECGLVTAAPITAYEMALGIAASVVPSR